METILSQEHIYLHLHPKTHLNVIFLPPWKSFKLLFWDMFLSTRILYAVPVSRILATCSAQPPDLTILTL
jgi:hypothetical protein